MFDFFCHYHPSVPIGSVPLSPFASMEIYSALAYDEVHVKGNGYSFFILNRKNETNTTFFENENFLVGIYGYLFSNSADNQQIGSYQAAADVLGLLNKGLAFNPMNYKGSYSLLILDKLSLQLRVITDPLNVKTVYFDKTDTSCFLSSSLDAIVAQKKLSGYSIEINRLVIYQQLLLDLIPSEDSMIRNISTLPPGNILTLEPTGMKMEEYWNTVNDLPYRLPQTGKRVGFQRINNYLKNQLLTFCSYPGKLAMAFTGGYDSRTLLALLGEKVKDIKLYSYGHSDSWDIRIPGRISEKMEYAYETFRFGSEFETSYSENTCLALSLTSGTALFTQADIPYIYHNHLKENTAVISGLFGSELLKYPTGRGLVVNDNMLKLLFSDDLKVTSGAIFDTLPESIFQDGNRNHLKDEFIHDLLHNPFLKSVSQLDKTQRIFYYLLQLGARKYFSKEIAMERPFLENLHPFWDVGFVQQLVQTPFSWIHLPWSEKKSYFTNLRLHSLYARLIHSNNPRLSCYISTHATRPLFLTNPIFIPLLLLDYQVYRKKIKKQTFSYSPTIIRNHEDTLLGDNNKRLFFQENLSKRQFVKLLSMNQWCKQTSIEPFW